MLELHTLRAFIIASPILSASLSSLWGAIAIDVWQFIRSKGPGDFFSQWQWKIALWRYSQALASGFMGNFLVAGAGSMVALAIYRFWF